MKLIQGILYYANAGLSRKFLSPQVIRTFSTNPGFDANKLNRSSFESTDDFEQRIFGDTTGKSQTNNSFYRHLDKAERDHNRFWQGSNINSEKSSTFLDGLDESFSTLSDGMGDKLKEAARYFEYDPEEVEKEDYSFRKDVTFWPGNTYDIKDLDLRKPGVQKPMKRAGFETTTEEVLQKADFRNVRFLANFITDAGIIIKRSKTRISAKAQRKVAREIKTARAFGLLPFTTMGTKHFVFGRTMENLEEDYAYETNYPPNFVDADGCDASVLLDDTPNFVGEKTAGPNLNSLRGFEVIDSIKADLEFVCPETVSCADILAIAARDSVLLSGGPAWEVEMGRRDSISASKTAANNNIPGPNSDVPTLVSKFQNLGLTLQDMVTLSGAHTLGKARCFTFNSRLNSGNTPDVNVEFLQSLQQLCSVSDVNATLADLDAITPANFDNQYYVNLLSGKGLLTSDQVLANSDDQTRGIVESYIDDPTLFFESFKSSMMKMGSLAPGDGAGGEIRRNCRVVNQVNS